MRSVPSAVTSGYLRRPAAPAARLRRIAASAAWLLTLTLTLTLAGCAAVSAALRTNAALQDAGYQNVNVNVAFGSGLPADGLVRVSYSSGPAGNDQRDAQRAEKIVWDTFPGRFGALAIIKESGGCAGPFCATQSDEVASATYAQLAAGFGPRPPGLDKASAALPNLPRAIPTWVVVAGFALVAAIIAAAAIVLTLILKRKKRNPPPGPPPWPPGPPGGWPTGSPYRAA